MIKKALIFWIVLLAAAALLPHASEELRVARDFCDTIGRRYGGVLRPHRPSPDQSTSASAQAEAGNASERIAEMPSAVEKGRDSEAGSDVLPKPIKPAIQCEELERAVAAVPDDGLRHALESSLAEQGSYASQFRQLLVRRWAESDPKAAASWVGNLQNPADAASVTKQVAIGWANKDLSGALEWASALPEGPSRDAAVIGIGYEAARTNSFEAFDLVAAMAPSAERDALLVHSVRQWAAADSVEAASWAERVPDKALRERLLSAVAVSSASKDPYVAASLIATNLSAGRAQDLAAVAIAQRWAQSNTEAASAWINLFPDSSVKQAASLALGITSGEK